MGNVKFILTLSLIWLLPTFCSAAEQLIFVPHDARPICFQETAEVVEATGYEVLMPPEELFGGKGEYMGQPEEIWQWLESKVKSAEAAVVSIDSLFYGGLIPSRKHEITPEVLKERIERFKALRTKNPKLKIYAFASLMRTPQAGVAGFTEEPEYYVPYGSRIFRLTALLDKSEIDGLSESEWAEVSYLKSAIPADVLNDWFGRRDKNLTVTKQFLDLLEQGGINCLVIGRDDNATLSQTHKEHRDLNHYAKKYNLDESKYQTLAGIDEIGLLLLTRALNDLRKERPKININFNKGKGSKTIPAFSDEEIGESIAKAVTLAGGRIVDDPANTDLILLVNTDLSGKTHLSHNALPDSMVKLDTKRIDKSAENFAAMVEEYIEGNYPVAVADVAFANGADNTLMDKLYSKGLLFKVQAYSGWNTATNSTGFALGTGMLAKSMSNDAKDRLLVRRYLEDWGYQANVRTFIGTQLYNSREGGVIYYSLGSHTQTVADRVTWFMRDFATKHLPPFDYLKDLEVTLPWDRMFECDIDLKY